MTLVELFLVRIVNGCWEPQIQGDDFCVSIRAKGEANVLDLYYYFKANKKPEIGSKMQVILSSEQIADCDTVFELNTARSSSSCLSLLDTTMCEELFLLGLPDEDIWSFNSEIHAKFVPINKGLKAFVERTGMKGLLKE